MTKSNKTIKRNLLSISDNGLRVSVNNERDYFSDNKIIEQLDKLVRVYGGNRRVMSIPGCKK